MYHPAGDDENQNSPEAPPKPGDQRAAFLDGIFRLRFLAGSHACRSDLWQQYLNKKFRNETPFGANLARDFSVELPQYSPVVSQSADEFASFIRAVEAWPRSDREIQENLCRRLQALTLADWAGAQLFPYVRHGYPAQIPDSLEPILGRLMEIGDVPNGAQSARTRQVWTPSHLLFWVPLSAGIQDRRSQLGWVAVAYLRTELPATEQQQWIGSQERLLQALAGHLDHLAVESELQQQVKTRERFLSIASHELKTPLTSIYGILQLQERMMKSSAWPIELRADQERQLAFLQLVLRQAERMTELIDGLLDVSKIQAGRFAVEPMITDVSTLAGEVVAGRLSLLAQESGVQMLREFPAQLSAWVDPTRFEEVVSNLTMNALRMSPEGGVIWVRLRQEGNDVVLSVRDQGQALSPEDRSKVFEPFERAQVVARMGGLGLGLFISRQIARLHGGDVVLLPSLAATGNVFEARFPIRKPLS